MSEDFTQKLPENGNESKILTAIKDLEKKVDNLEKKVDERLHDTRPIWHKVVADISELHAGQRRLEKGQQDMLEEISELTNTVRNVNRDQIVINDSIRRMQMDFHTVDEKLHKLTRERQNSQT
jgi:chromosome segregation ATPase